MSRILITAAVALATMAGAASAATCADRAHVVTQLEKRFGETLYANAVSRSSNVLEVFASESANTWSITVFLPDRGLSCLSATGKGRADLEVALAGQ